jgi:hypothetical protein
MPFGEVGVKAILKAAYAGGSGECVDDREADVMAGPIVTLARIAEAHDELH